MNLSPRMEKWIETRLWNLKVKNRPIIIRQISSELIDFFKLRVTYKTREDLMSEIEKIRFRIYKRYKKWCDLRKEWAEQYGLPEQLIQRWYRKGWIDPKKPDTFYDIMNMIVERDYYFRFIEYQNIDKEIPEDPDISLSKL